MPANRQKIGQFLVCKTRPNLTQPLYWGFSLLEVNMNEWQEYIKTVEKQVAEEVRKQYPDLKFYIVIDQDPRYPLVVFNDNPNNPEWDNYKGYTWSMENNKLGHNVCTCHAFEPDECICGAWDSVDRDEWYAEEYN